MGSTRTSPVNLELLAGFRTTSRVLYGCPLAVPEMKYSLASYLKAAKPLPGANDCVESYIGPGPVTCAETIGSATAVGFWGRFTAGAGAWPRPACPRPCPCAIAQGVAISPAMRPAASSITRVLLIVVS